MLISYMLLYIFIKKKKKEGGVPFSLRTLEILSTHFQVPTTFIILLQLITFDYHHVALKKRHDK